MRQALAKGPAAEHVTALRGRLAQFQQRRPFRA
jgi:hypothetical protein